MKRRRVWHAALVVAALLATPPMVAATQPRSLAEAPDFASPAAKAQASVVSITTIRHAASAGLDFLTDRSPLAKRVGALQDAPEAHRAEIERCLASGLIVRSDGEILTNAHVVADADQVLVRLADGRQFEASVLGLDKTTDVALIRIEARDLPAATLGLGKHPATGEWVLAIGSPFGLERSVTAGIISAPQRFLPGTAVPLIQTDVAINPGSSGGPLLNVDGDVIGLNAMVFSLTGGYAGVSFAVPIELAMRVADELRASGHVSRGQLGAKIQELTPELAMSFGLREPKGALVLRVLPGSPAQHGGLRSGDILLGTGGSLSAGFVELQTDVAAARPGDRLVLNVWRHGTVQRIELVVGEAAIDPPARPQRASNRHDERLGLNLGEMPTDRLASLGLEGGVPVLESHGAAARGGVQADDVVVAVGDRAVGSVADFDIALASFPAGRPVALLVLRNRVLAFMAIDPVR